MADAAEPLPPASGGFESGVACCMADAPEPLPLASEGFESGVACLIWVNKRPKRGGIELIGSLSRGLCNPSGDSTVTVH